MISQPSLLINCRVLLAASSGLPLESRVMSSILRPPRPPAALNLSASICSEFRDEIPSCATRPERMVGTPMRMVLFCARETKGNPIPAAVTALAALMNPRRFVSVLFFPFIAFSWKINGPATLRSGPCMLYKKPRLPPADTPTRLPSGTSCGNHISTGHRSREQKWEAVFNSAISIAGTCGAIPPPVRRIES